MTFMDEMIKIVLKYPIGTIFEIEWKNIGLILKGELDDKYESYNCLAEDDPNYREYYACILKISEILQKPENFFIAPGELIEISIENKPSCIKLQDKTIIWENKNV